MLYSFALHSKYESLNMTNFDGKLKISRYIERFFKKNFQNSEFWVQRYDIRGRLHSYNTEDQQEKNADLTY